MSWNHSIMAPYKLPKWTNTILTTQWVTVIPNYDNRENIPITREAHKTQPQTDCIFHRQLMANIQRCLPLPFTLRHSKSTGHLAIGSSKINTSAMHSALSRRMKKHGSSDGRSWDTVLLLLFLFLLLVDCHTRATSTALTNWDCSYLRKMRQTWCHETYTIYPFAYFI